MIDRQYQYRFLDVVIRKGEIAIWNKMRVAQSQKLFRKKYLASENPQQMAEQFIDHYWYEHLAFELDDQNWLVVKGLQQNLELRQTFLKTMFDLAARYQKKWEQEVYFRFALTANLKEGKSAKPNYQIESEDGHYTATFRFNGDELLNSGEEMTEFNDGNTSSRFSVEKLKKIWLVY